MNSAARRFVLLTVSVSSLLVGGIGLLNYLVDPYNRFGNNRLGVYISAEREAKPTEVRRYPHDALLLGNSRMAMIPVAGLDHFHFFNAAFGGGTAEEAYYFINHFARSQDLAVLGVDPGAGDPPTAEGDIFAPLSWTARLNSIFNLSTVEYSLRTISEHLSGHPPSLRVDGSFDATRWFELYDRDDPGRLNYQLQILNRLYGGYAGPVRQPMTFYQKIADCLRRRGITCVVVVPPLHEAVATNLTAAATRAAYADWQRELEQLFPHVVDLSSSSYSAAENFFRIDPVHFKPEVGVRMLNAEVIPLAARLVAERTNGVAGGAR